jgi:hypothetical protein
VPAVNPIISSDVTPGEYPAGSDAPFAQAQLTGVSGLGGVSMNQATPTNTNAAGTSENISMHVAVLVAIALIGVYVLRQSGFKFVVAVGA